MDVSERLTLAEISAGTPVAAEHIHRYELAAELVAGGRLLDLGCGSGYGTALLARAGMNVTGVDIDADAIGEARLNLAVDGEVEFQVADAADFLLGGRAASFDAIVCFETIEHVQDPAAIAASLAEYAADGTQIVLSVPNSLYFGEENAFHLTDFGYESALELFDSIGEHVLIEQHLAEGSFIRSGDDGLDSDGRRHVALDGHAESHAAHHFIAAYNCGSALDTALARLQVVAAPQHARHIRAMSSANRELWRVNSRLGEAAIGGVDVRGSRSGSGAASALDGIARRAERAESRVAELERELQAAIAAHAAIANSRSWRWLRGARAAIRLFAR